MADNDICKCTDPQYTIKLNAQGPQGIRGEQGPQGYSPTVSVYTNTQDQYRLLITTATGETITPNLIGPQGPQGTTPDIEVDDNTIIMNSNGELQVNSEIMGYTVDKLLTVGSSEVTTIQLNSNGRPVAGDYSTGTLNDIAYVSDLDEYALLADIPEVPTKTSELVNDSGYITISSVPTRVSQLQNDAGYITNNDIDTSNLVTLDGNQNIAGVKNFTNSFITRNMFMNGNVIKLNGAGILMITDTNNNSGAVLTSDKRDYYKASKTSLGFVKVDGTTVTINDDGVISAITSIPSNIYTKDEVDNLLAPLEARIAALEAMIDGGNA